MIYRTVSTLNLWIVAVVSMIREWQSGAHEAEEAAFLIETSLRRLVRIDTDFAVVGLLAASFLHGGTYV